MSIFPRWDRGLREHTTFAPRYAVPFLTQKSLTIETNCRSCHSPLQQLNPTILVVSADFWEISPRTWLDISTSEAMKR